MLASVGSGADGLVLAGHTDTVPCDAERWSSDPFTLTDRDGLWYGLGAADMKSFFPIVLAALIGLDPNRGIGPANALWPVFPGATSIQLGGATHRVHLSPVGRAG